MRILLIAAVVLLQCGFPNAYGQPGSEEQGITMSFENWTLREVFREAEIQAGIPFAYSSEIAPLKVSGSFTGTPLAEFLDSLFAGKNLSYKFLGSQVTVFFKMAPAPSPRQNIRGEVYDYQSKTPLPGASVRLAGVSPATGTISEADGTFILKDLPIGRYSLEISFIGYQTRIVDNIVLGAGKEEVLQVGMIEEVSKLEDVVISGYRNMVVPTNQTAVVSARSISSQEAQRFAGSLSDPARMALSYAGVTSSNGYTNEIIVRGNSPSGLLWRLEGIEIPNPNHYAVEGSSGGFVNILNSSNMARSDFFVSAFPSEFGNATSGIFDLKMRKGNADTYEHSIEAATIGLRASTEGPLGSNRGSYLLNYRYSAMGSLHGQAATMEFTGELPTTWLKERLAALQSPAHLFLAWRLSRSAHWPWLSRGLQGHSTHEGPAQTIPSESASLSAHSGPPPPVRFLRAACECRASEGRIVRIPAWQNRRGRISHQFARNADHSRCLRRSRSFGYR